MWRTRQMERMGVGVNGSVILQSMNSQITLECEFSTFFGRKLEKISFVYVPFSIGLSSYVLYLYAMHGNSPWLQYSPFPMLNSTDRTQWIQIFFRNSTKMQLFQYNFPFYVTKVEILELLGTEQKCHLN